VAGDFFQRWDVLKERPAIRLPFVLPEEPLVRTFRWRWDHEPVGPHRVQSVQTFWFRIDEKHDSLRFSSVLSRVLVGTVFVLS